jgi:hypothetical protein
VSQSSEKERVALDVDRSVVITLLRVRSVATANFILARAKFTGNVSLVFVVVDSGFPSRRSAGLHAARQFLVEEFFTDFIQITIYGATQCQRNVQISAFFKDVWKFQNICHCWKAANKVSAQLM